MHELMTNDQAVRIVMGVLTGLLVWTLFWGFYSGAKR